MLICLILSVLYKNQFHIYTAKSQYEMPSFGFDANGTYFIDFENIPPDYQTPLQVAFLNKKEYKKIFFKFFPPSICDLLYIPKFEINSSQHILKGTFTEKIELYPFLLRCDVFSDILDITVITEYHNPTTYLDNRMIKGINAEMAICILCFIFSISWLINLFYNFNSLNGLHYCITAIIFCFMFTSILRFCELQRLDKSDDSKTLTQSRIVFSYFVAALVCLFFLFGAEGYCMFVESLSKERIIIHIIISAFFAGCIYLTVYYEFTENFNMLILMDLVAAILYMHELYSAMKRANVQVVALLLAASNAGTSQGATSFLQNKQYIYFQRILISVLIIVIFFLIFSYISFMIQNWIIELIINLTEITVLAIIAFFFRPKKLPSNTSSTSISNRLIDEDNDIAINDVENETDGDEIPLHSLDNTTDYLRNGPTPDQPLLQQNPSAEPEKKTNGNNYVYL